MSNTFGRRAVIWTASVLAFILANLATARAQQSGVMMVGPRGITETVDQIMARQAHSGLRRPAACWVVAR